MGWGMTSNGLTVVRDEGEYLEIAQSLRARFASGSFVPAAKDIASPDWMKLQCIYYYSVRCSMQPILESGSLDEPMRDALATLREGCMDDAKVLAAAHVCGAAPVAPKWFGALIDNLRSHPDPTAASLAKSTEFALDVSAAALVRISNKEQRLYVSIPSMLKAYLGQLAHIFLNPIYAEEEPEKDGDGAERAAGFLLHMLWLTREEFNPVALPVSHPPSRRKHDLALAVADAQLAYLCLHELAHAALGHTGDANVPPPSLPTGQRYAYKMVGKDGKMTFVSSSVPCDDVPLEPVWAISTREQEEVDADAWAEARLREMGWSSDVATLAVALTTEFLMLSTMVRRCRFEAGRVVLRPAGDAVKQRSWRSRFSGTLAQNSDGARELVDWVEHLVKIAVYLLGKMSAEDVAAFQGTRKWD